MSAPERIHVWVCAVCKDWQRDPGPCRNVCGNLTHIHTYDIDPVCKSLHQEDKKEAA